MHVPFHRPEITDAEVAEVEAVLRSGWLTSGPRVSRFEDDFKAAVGARHAIALNSGTAALHVAGEALGLVAGKAVLTPTMTFAATAEVVLHLGATPILVDCEPGTLNMDLDDAKRKIEDLKRGRLPASRELEPVGIIAVHVGGCMMDLDAVSSFALERGLWVVEDAAHAFPAAWRNEKDAPWTRCGASTSSVACFSFYANKTITTGEGGMAVTEDDELAERMRIMSLHGLSRDAWDRYSRGGSWDYQILAPGFKYNCTDIAAAIGIHQLKRAEQMRLAREAVATAYIEAFAEVDEIELPPSSENRIHSWHLFSIKLNLERLTINRNDFFDELRNEGVHCSVHWRPLHLHPYFYRVHEWEPHHFPVATELWKRLISLPIFPSMSGEETDHVIRVVTDLCRRHRR